MLIQMWRHTQGRLPCDVTMEAEFGVRCLSTSRGTPRIAGNQQKLEEAKKDSRLECPDGASPCGHLDFRLSASKTVGE